MPNELPYLPFFVGDFLVTVSTWPSERVGAYVLALFYQWEHGGLPADDERELARILHESRPRTRRLWGEFGHKFQKRMDGLWWHARLEKVRVTAREQVAAASNRGRKGATARWGKGAQADPQAMPEHMPEHSLSNANQSKIQTKYTPLSPPAAQGGRPRRRISAKEREKAEAFLSQIRHCPHTPRCETHAHCIGVVVQLWRSAEADGQAAAVGEAS